MSNIIATDKESVYAYACIHDFFNHYDLPDARQTLESILHAAFEQHLWKKETPYNLIYFIQNLEQLLTAGFTICESYLYLSAAVSSTGSKGNIPSNPAEDFITNAGYLDPWDNFPRSLTAKQYHDPYKAIKKSCNSMSLNEWKAILKELLEYALSNSSLTTTDPPYNILTIRLRLLQLIEASHLINHRLKKTKPENKNTSKRKTNK